MNTEKPTTKVSGKPDKLPHGYGVTEANDPNYVKTKRGWRLKPEYLKPTGKPVSVSKFLQDYDGHNCKKCGEHFSVCICEELPLGDSDQYREGLYDGRQLAAEVARAALAAWESECYSVRNARYNAWRQGRAIPAESTIKHYEGGCDALIEALQEIIKIGESI